MILKPVQWKKDIWGGECAQMGVFACCVLRHHTQVFRYEIRAQLGFGFSSFDIANDCTVFFDTLEEAKAACEAKLLEILTEPLVDENDVEAMIEYRRALSRRRRDDQA